MAALLLLWSALWPPHFHLQRPIQRLSKHHFCSWRQQGWIWKKLWLQTWGATVQTAVSSVFISLHLNLGTTGNVTFPRICRDWSHQFIKITTVYLASKVAEKLVNRHSTWSMQHFLVCGIWLPKKQLVVGFYIEMYDYVYNLHYIIIILLRLLKLQKKWKNEWS